MQTIYKYQLELTEHQFIEMHLDAKILSVKNKFGVLQLWALVDPDKQMAEKSIFIIGTGQPQPYNFNKFVFINTVFMDMYVWHVFEEVFN